MKVILVNGSPNQRGCTYRALQEIAGTLSQEGIDSEIFWLGKKPLNGCLACWHCGETGECVFDDAVREFHRIADDADGYVFGSPVHYASAAGALTAFMDRVFMSEQYGNGGCHFRLKPAAAIVSARRAGTTAALDRLNKYFSIMEMPVISSCYWNMVHGQEPEEVEQDLEGLQVMRVLARNMAYFLKCRQAAENAGIRPPQQEESVATNFIR
ncbi:MAG: flavodoxin family protein [Lachnospiraceae bacterium]